MDSFATHLKTVSAILLPIGFVRLHSNSVLQRLHVLSPVLLVSHKVCRPLWRFQHATYPFLSHFTANLPLNVPLHEVYRCPGLSRMRMGGIEREAAHFLQPYLLPYFNFICHICSSYIVFDFFPLSFFLQMHDKSSFSFQPYLSPAQALIQCATDQNTLFHPYRVLPSTRFCSSIFHFSVSCCFSYSFALVSGSAENSF